MHRVTAGDWVLAAAVLAVGFAAFYPFLYVLALALSDTASIVAGKVALWPVGFNLEAFRKVMGDRRIGLGFSNALLYTGTHMVFATFMTMLTAYPLSEALRYKRFLMGIIIGAMLFSGGLIPFYLLIKNIGWVDTIWAIIIPGAVGPFNLILARTFIEQLPREVLESGTIDGCSHPGLFLRIVLPLSMPIVATLALYNAVGMWNAYFGPMLFLNREEKYPLQVFLRQIVIVAQSNEAEMSKTGAKTGQIVAESVKAAVLVVSAAPILVFYPFMQKYFVKGILIGAIKG